MTVEEVKRKFYVFSRSFSKFVNLFHEFLVFFNLFIEYFNNFLAISSLKLKIYERKIFNDIKKSIFN